MLSIFSCIYWASLEKCLFRLHKSMNLEHILSPYRKINSKWLKDLNIRHDNHKTLRREHRQTFSDINHTNVFLGQSPKAIKIKTKISKWDLIKLTSCCTARETINRAKRQPTGWKKIFRNDETDKGFFSKMYKQLVQLNSNKKHPNPKMDMNCLRIV